VHDTDYTIVRVARASDILKSPFAFLFQRPQKEELVAEYVVREHHSGRTLNDILEDAYVTNRLNKDEVGRVLDRPEVIHALGEDVIRTEL
jgi:hypothetical protein